MALEVAHLRAGGDNEEHETLTLHPSAQPAQDSHLHPTGIQLVQDVADRGLYNHLRVTKYRPGAPLR
jgi:hypothetical protein